jgi:hypothetical protein
MVVGVGVGVGVGVALYEGRLTAEDMSETAMKARPQASALTFRMAHALAGTVASLMITILPTLVTNGE